MAQEKDTEKALAIRALKDELRKLKGKALVDNKKIAHSAYIKHSQEEAAVLRDLVDHIKANYPLDPLLESAYKYTKLIPEMLSKISKTCPSINSSEEQLVAVTPRNKVKKVRFTEPVTSSRNTKTAHISNLASNKPMLSSTGVKHSTSASGSQPSGNTKKDKIQQTQSRILKNKVEAHPRKVKSSLKNKDHVVEPKGTAPVQHSKLNANSDLQVKLKWSSKLSSGQSTAKPHKPKSEDTNQEKLYLVHMDLCGPMRVASVNGKKTYAQYNEKVGISHETSVARSPQQNDVTSLQAPLITNIFNPDTAKETTSDTLMVEKSKLDEDKERKAVNPSHYHGSAYRKALKCRKKDLLVSKRNHTSGTMVSEGFFDCSNSICRCGSCWLSKDTRRTRLEVCNFCGDKLVIGPTKRQKSAAYQYEAEFICFCPTDELKSL
ncbi:hypothetical protein Tco_0455943 [Tanacetum coccineum]